MSNAAVEELANVENVGDNNNEEIRQQIRDLRTQIDQSYWDFAEALHKVWKDTLFMEWGHEDWTHYVENELDYQLRTAQYLVGIIDYFGKMPPKIQEWVKSLGWSKAKELVNKVDEKNFTEMKKKLKGRSVAQIVQFFKDAKASEASASGNESGGEEKIRKSFTLVQAQLENVEAALAKAMEDAKSDKEGHALDLIATSFLSTAGGASDLNSYLASFERTFGVKLIAYSAKNDEIVYGEETLDSIVAVEEDEEEEVREDNE